MSSSFDHHRFLTAIGEYVVAQLDDSDIGGLSYTGLLPAINSREDYKNFPTSLYPFVGVAPIGVTYQDQSLGQYFPTYPIQVIFSNRDPGIDPDALMADMLRLTQQLETILIDTIKTDMFGLSDFIQAAELQSLSFASTFYTEVDGDRKGYSIAYFNVRLFLGGI